MTHGLVWFRRDLRIHDNPAWSAATGQHDAVTALFVIDPALWPEVTARRRDLLTGHIRELDRRMRERKGRLRVERGDPVEVVAAVAAEIGADAVHLNRDVSPYGLRRDRGVAAAVGDLMSGHDGLYVVRPGTLLTGDGDPYRVFTPFYEKWLESLPDPVPDEGKATIASEPGSGIPQPDGELPHEPGELAALDRLDAFLDLVDDYADDRDRPDLDHTSHLSIDLKWGTLGPRAVLDAVGRHTEGRRAFVRQLAWRDFHAHVMAIAPDLHDAPFRPEYAAITWRDDPAGFEAWTSGHTGYPIIDAGMRQLRTEGWMHNRVRMLTASFLVKDLLIDWRKGERWFRRHLLDADVPQNAGNWQWVAGTGTDAAPYFRIFNPVTQSQRYDPEGAFIRRWVPELADLDGRSIHAPWERPEALTEADIVLGRDYPGPIVDHAEAREATLARYAAAKG